MKKERFTIDAWLQDMSRKVVDEDGDSVDPRVCSLGWLLERQDRLRLITPEPELTEFEKDTDWDAFRREAAKDILAGFAANSSRPLVNVEVSIKLADELINKLKEGKK